ncbi:MAG: hypothetical protein JSW67_00145 [Candidatus Latescibacterota bacterium]|nr:MAG: hypothetical protein JSW67_00145 [Candidatus Latescibacterota bacterium]
MSVWGGANASIAVQEATSGGEPDGISDGDRLQVTCVFTAAWDAQTLDHTVTGTCGVGGEAQLLVTCGDATSFERTISWSANGATVSVTGRDGGSLQGTWSRTGSSATFTHAITFPSGHDPVSVHQEGSAVDAAGTRSYSAVSTWLDGHEESLQVDALREADGRRTLTGVAITPAGTTTFGLEWDPQAGVLSGNSAGPDDESGSFTWTRLEDGAALLVFTWTDPSEDLMVNGTATIGPDGSGCGELEISHAGTTGTVPFCFEGNGRGHVGSTDPIPF